MSDFRLLTEVNAGSYDSVILFNVALIEASAGKLTFFQRSIYPESLGHTFSFALVQKCDDNLIFFFCTGHCLNCLKAVLGVPSNEIMSLTDFYGDRLN